jgi:N-formylmaleamate deformylase
MEFIPGTVISNGIRLHYHTTGEGQPVVFLHGITDNGLCWRRTARALAEDYQVVLVDARGHGLSEKPEKGYTPEIHAADAAGLIEGLGLQRPVVVGHSMGAAAAAALAATRPELLSGIVLEDPPWLPGQIPPEWTEGARLEWEKDLLALQALSKEEVEAQGRLNNPGWDAQDLPDWAEAKLQTSPSALRYIIESCTPWIEDRGQTEDAWPADHRRAGPGSAGAPRNRPARA